MLHSLLVFAQHAAEEEEGSKSAYYVAGIALALFAVLVSAVGIRRHDRFPGSKRAMRAIMALAAVLVALTMASAVLTG